MATTTTSTKEVRKAKRSKAGELKKQLEGLKWLGRIVMWNSGPDGACHKQTDVTTALTRANLDPRISRELLPRHAFARAARTLSDERIIEVFKENDTEIIFQFSRKHLDSSGWTYPKESFVYLNKTTGDVRADDSDLAVQAQTQVDKAIETRTNADITRIVQKSFEQHADLIPMRDAGGVYFVPEEHAEFINRVETFLTAVGGSIEVIPIPEGSDSGDRAIQNAVSSTMEKLISDHFTEVKSFEVNTRKDTITRVAERINGTRVKIEAYAHYLGQRQKELLQKIEEANELLKEQVEKIGGGAKEYTEYDWDTILDGRVHKLVQGEDFLGKAISVLSRARVHAKRRGLKIRTAVREEGRVVILQAKEATPEELEAEQEDE